MVGLGQRLRDLRESRNIAQAEVARQLNLAKSTIAGYESNSTSPSLDSLCVLAEFYNVSTDYLLGREKNKKLVADLSKLDSESVNLVTQLIDKLHQKNKPKKHP